MSTNLLGKIHHATDYLTSSDPVQVDIYATLDELRNLGYTVNCRPASRSDDWTLTVHDGDEELISKKGLFGIMRPDTLADLRRIAEHDSVVSRLQELEERMANVGWKSRSPQDGRVQIDKPSGRSRTYDLTYVHLAEIEGELTHAEFCKFILPRAHKLGQIIKDGCHMASSRWSLIRLELAELGSKIVEAMDAGPAVPDTSLADELAREFETPADPPEPTAEEAPLPPLPDDPAVAIAVVQTEPESTGSDAPAESGNPTAEAEQVPASDPDSATSAED